jgi:hypothetical protein
MWPVIVSVHSLFSCHDTSRDQSLRRHRRGNMLTDSTLEELAVECGQLYFVATAFPLLMSLAGTSRTSLARSTKVRPQPFHTGIVLLQAPLCIAHIQKFILHYTELCTSDFPRQAHVRFFFRRKRKRKNMVDVKLAGNHVPL